MRDGSNDRRELSIQSDRSRVNSKSSLFGQAGRDMDIYGTRDTAGSTPPSRLLASLPRYGIGIAACGWAAAALISGRSEERGGGKESGSTGRSRGSPAP